MREQVLLRKRSPVSGLSTTTFSHPLVHSPTRSSTHSRPLQQVISHTTMSASEWEKVKELAADFQRVQATTSLQRLSDRNCIDVVKKLISLNLIEVFFTCDGKEYVTPEYLLREIEDELVVNGGRVHLTELASALNIDYSHIDAKASELARDSSGDISIVLGQLISSDYKDRIAEEINQKLRETGVVNVAELSKQYDLPANFMETMMSERLGNSISGVRDPSDPRTIFTESYVNQYRAKLRGILSATTRPTALSQIFNRFNVPEKIALSCIEALIREDQLKGSIHSGSRTYTPEIHVQGQKDFADDFYKQNSYLDYATLAKIGISEPRSFCANRFTDSISLKTCCVSNSFLFQLDSAIEECISSKSIAEISSFVPSVLSEKDIEELVDKGITGNKSLEGARLMSGSIFVSNDLISSIQAKLEEEIPKKTNEDLKSGKLFSYFASKQSAREAVADDGKFSKKDERKKKAAGKTHTGGGTQGREVKIKNTKKKYKPGQKGRGEDESDDEFAGGKADDRGGEAGTSRTQLILMSRDELTNAIKNLNPEIEEASPDLCREISDILFEPLNSKYVDAARELFADNSASAAASKKKTHADLQQQLTSLHLSIHLFQKGLDLVTDPLKGQLTKYLQKSLCTDAINLLISYVSSDSNPNLQSAESRAKVISKLDPDLKERLTQLAAVLNASSLDGFLEQLEAVAQKNEIVLKPVDKKREKNFLSESRQNLILQLEGAVDAGLTLHLSVLLIFQSITGSAIHASGKFVPQIIQEIRSRLEKDTFDLLSQFEQLVISHVRASRQENSSPDEVHELEEQLKQLQPLVKDAAIRSKAQQ